MFKNFLWLGLLFFINCACTNSQLGYNSPEFLRKASRAVVVVTVDYDIQEPITLVNNSKTKFATGFSFERKNGISYILTNQHVCSMHEKAKYTLTTYTGVNVLATFVGVDEFADICMLRTESNIPPLKLANEDSKRGERITTIGAPDTVYPVIYDGVMSGYRIFNMKNDVGEDGIFEVHFRAQISSVPLYNGSSGSPVLNMNGEVVGIVFAGRVNKDHISYIVPVSEVLRFISVEDYVLIKQ